jgi:hypothetical protein
MTDYRSRAGKPVWVFLLIFVVASLGLRFSACAIVDAKSRANTNAPPDGSPWASVGRVNTSSGIYLGAGWVLTAAHVGATDATFGSTVYPWDGTSLRLTNPANGSVTDMVMFHLRTLPPLPRMPLATTTPAASSQVTMIGYGCIAGSAQTNFGAYTGFYWSLNGLKSWGNNKVDPGGTAVITVPQGDVTTFRTTFSSSLQTSDEAQAAGGDSGGGVFQLSGSTWQLVGLLDAVTHLQNTYTAVYGDMTYSADIATYRAQIVSTISATRPTMTISRSGTNVIMSWPDTGVTYNLMANRNLSTGSWTLLTPTLTLTNGQFYASLPATNGPNFFRLQKQ